ncbi:MAG: TonB-dependent receptor [Bacteroidia bacterium]|nr:TonB-dependent receptor [Bacteroidia bacterium]MBT8277023.1 TonB-dependent receptor [Bacteroidia bacterium]NNF31908.1 TonB-dependent receptor [Flavobacteriaceae bacterium]NNK53596.1 TonB-dependent receptor [Flavobacteriaceae bacterium]NNM08903.1 TonB-dependent receptor [Flavobacteriaceae bacterium]
MKFRSSLIGLFITCLATAQVQVQDSTDTTQKIPELLDEVLLSSNILGSKFEVKNRTGSAYFVSPQELQQFGYTDANKILRAVPGVSIYEEDGFGLRPNISLRGSSPERSAKITLMEDNVLIAPAPYSAPAAYYFPTVGRIESIEVLKGSSQVQYGPYTTGGAINFISKKIPKKFSGNVRLNMGNYSSRNVEATLGDSGENFGFVTQFFNYSSDGFKTLGDGSNTGFDKTDILGKLRWNTNKTAKVFQSFTLKLQYSEEDSNETYLGLTDADFEIDPFRRYAASQADNMVNEHTQYQLNYLIKPNSNISINTTANFNKFKRNWYKLDDIVLDEKVKISEVLADPVSFKNEYRALLGNVDTPDDAFGVKANNRSYESKGIQSRINFKVGSTWMQDVEIGLRYHEDYEDRFQWKDLYALQNRTMVRTTVAIPGTDSNRISSAKALAGHALFKLRIDGLTLTPGLRYENIKLLREDFGKEDPFRTGGELSTRENEVDVFIPGVGAHYRFNNDISLFGGVHKGFAPPGSTEGADPEESLNLELGTRFYFMGFKGEIVGFYNDYSNLLGSDLAATGGTGSLEQFNAGEASVAGLELLLNYDLLNGENTNAKLRLPLTLSYTFTDAQFSSDFDSDDSVFGTVQEGDEIPYIARNQFNVTAALENSVFNVSMSGRFTDEFRTEAGSGDIPDQFRISGNFVMDLAARYFYNERVTLFANMMNVLDTKYEVARLPAGLRPGAPFMVNAGIGYTF